MRTFTFTEDSLLDMFSSQSIVDILNEEGNSEFMKYLHGDEDANVKRAIEEITELAERFAIAREVSRMDNEELNIISERIHDSDPETNEKMREWLLYFMAGHVSKKRLEEMFNQAYKDEKGLDWPWEMPEER